MNTWSPHLEQTIGVKRSFVWTDSESGPSPSYVQANIRDADIRDANIRDENTPHSRGNHAMGTATPACPANVTANDQTAANRQALINMSMSTTAVNQVEMYQVLQQISTQVGEMRRVQLEMRKDLMSLRNTILENGAGRSSQDPKGNGNKGTGGKGKLSSMAEGIERYKTGEQAEMPALMASLISDMEMDDWKSKLMQGAHRDGFMREDDKSFVEGMVSKYISVATVGDSSTAQNLCRLVKEQLAKNAHVWNNSIRSTIATAFFGSGADRGQYHQSAMRTHIQEQRSLGKLVTQHTEAEWAEYIQTSVKKSEKRKKNSSETPTNPAQGNNVERTGLVTKTMTRTGDQEEILDPALYRSRNGTDYTEPAFLDLAQALCKELWGKELIVVKNAMKELKIPDQILPLTNEAVAMIDYLINVAERGLQRDDCVRFTRKTPRTSWSNNIHGEPARDLYKHLLWEVKNCSTDLPFLSGRQFDLLWDRLYPTPSTTE